MKIKYLLTRFGGIGDCFPVLSVARYLKDQGHIVDVALREDDHGNKQIEFLNNTNYCNKALSLKEVGPWGNRCVPFKYGVVDIKSFYADYDEVIDFMHIVEYNDTCKSSFIRKPTDEWKKHRNSNWINWYDLHFAWANIDPNIVPEEYKRPEIILSGEEIEEVNNIKAYYTEIFVINSHASSLARTWYQSGEVIPLLLKKYNNPLMLNWEPGRGSWVAYTKEGAQKYTSSIKSPIRASVCVVKAASVYIGADTGFTHAAEGLGVDHISIYSSVPWWTRAKYYKHQTQIDNGDYTFSLTLGDPNRVKEGYDALSKKEKKLLAFHKSGASIQEAAKEFNTTPEGVDMEMQSIHKKIESFDRIQSKSISKIKPDDVVDMVEKILKYEVER